MRRGDLFNRVGSNPIGRSGFVEWMRIRIVEFTRLAYRFLFANRDHSNVESVRPRGLEHRLLHHRKDGSYSMKCFDSRIDIARRARLWLAAASAIGAVLASPPARADDPASAQASAPDREVVRVGVAAGMGAATEADAHDRGVFGAGSASIHAMPVHGLDLGLSLDVLSYGRDYVTTMPDGNGSPAGSRVHVDERMVRSRLTAGFEVLHLALDDESVALTPYLVFDVTSFVSGPFPQMPMSIGAGASMEADVHEHFRLLADFNYTHVVNTSRPSVQDLLYFGPLTGDFRFDLGMALVASPTARLELRYRGEVQVYQHDARALHAVLVGPTFSIR